MVNLPKVARNNSLEHSIDRWLPELQQRRYINAEKNTLFSTKTYTLKTHLKRKTVVFKKPIAPAWHTDPIPDVGTTLVPSSTFFTQFWSVLHWILRKVNDLSPTNHQTHSNTFLLQNRKEQDRLRLRFQLEATSYHEINVNAKMPAMFYLFWGNVGTDSEESKRRKQAGRGSWQPWCGTPAASEQEFNPNHGFARVTYSFDHVL